jgi:hypothetical protein
MIAPHNGILYEAIDPPRDQMVLLLALAAVPVALSLLAVGVYLLAAR